MIDFLFGASRASRTELSRDLSASRLNLTPSNLAIVGKQAAFLFQPHDLIAHDVASLEYTNQFITHGAAKFLEEGRQVAFFFEDGTRDKQALRRRMDHIFRTGEGVEKHLEETVKLGIELLHNGDGTAGYLSFIDTAYLNLVESFNHLPFFDKNLIRAFFEKTPKIFIPGDKPYKELDPRTNPPEVALNRTIQIRASSVVRDICAIGEIFREAERNENTSFFTIRGSNHMGMLTLMKILSEKTYPHLADLAVDVDSKRLVLSGNEHSQLILPLVWNRKFWNAVIEAYPDILELTKKIQPHQDLNRLSSVVRKVLNSEPWISYLQSTIAQQAASEKPPDDKIFPIILSQEDFA